jgi:hypothetical protein
VRGLGAFTVLILVLIFLARIHCGSLVSLPYATNGSIILLLFVVFVFPFPCVIRSISGRGACDLAHLLLLEVLDMLLLLLEEVEQPFSPLWRFVVLHTQLEK